MRSGISDFRKNNFVTHKVGGITYYYCRYINETKKSVAVGPREFLCVGRCAGCRFIDGVRFCDQNVGRNNAGLEKTGFKDTPISRPIPNETPTQNMFLKSSHRELSNGAIHITIQGDPDPNMHRSKSILI